MSSSQRIAVVLASLGMFLSTLDTGVINVALPSIVTSLHTTISATGGAVTGYAVALGLSILPFGRIADRVACARIYTFGMIVFACGSIGCAFASSALIAERIPRERRAGAFGTMSAFLSLEHLRSCFGNHANAGHRISDGDCGSGASKYRRGYATPRTEPWHRLRLVARSCAAQASRQCCGLVLRQRDLQEVPRPAQYRLRTA
ncbi:MAG: MFS transporter [Vulcanimicrobiaceae bacterium]